jgi:hypothetical protein
VQGTNTCVIKVKALLGTNHKYSCNKNETDWTLQPERRGRRSRSRGSEEVLEMWNERREEGGGEDRIGRSDQKWLEIGDWMSTTMIMWLEVGGGLIYKRRGQRRSVGVLASQASLRSDWIWMNFVNVGWNLCLQLRKDSGNIFVSLASLTREWILWTLKGEEEAPGFGVHELKCPSPTK